MPTVSRASGLTVSAPEAYRVEDVPRAPVEAPRRGGRPRRSGPVPMPTSPPPAHAERDPLLDALEHQDLTVVDRVMLEPILPPTPLSGTRRAPAEGVPLQQQAAVELTISADEDAVLLVEQNGVYSWAFSSKSEVRAGARTRERGMPTVTKHVHFEIGIRAARDPQATAQRGLISDLVYDEIRVYAIKFVAKVAIGAGMRFLERNVRRGLVAITSGDPTAWSLVAPADVTLPADRPARVLLFVHGTFSSTIGSFGALAGTPWGQEFLAAALAQYDAVLGLDHATLGDDPVANATELLAALEGLAAPMPPRLDVVAFSRGGLVFRSLVEHLLPCSSFTCRVERAVLVGCTNAGTQLANDENWHAFVDLYTNIAVAAFRLLTLMPQTAAPTLVLKELVQGLGAFVKYLAAYATGDVPGLAAMRPDGDFVRTLNSRQQDQPEPGAAAYYAITADFAPVIGDADHQPRELPRRLVLSIADGLVDRVMREPNDLVVNTRSMTAIDESVGVFVRDTFAFGATPAVYHTVYFTRPEVVNALVRWLELGAAETPTTTATPRPRGQPLPQIPSVRDRVAPMVVDTDIVLLDATDSSVDAVSYIERRVPSYVVVRRQHAGKRYHYAFTPQEVIAGATANADKSIGEALDLHEWQSSPEQPLETAARPPGSSGHVTVKRSVVLHNDVPVGVVPETPSVGDDIVVLAQMTAAFETIEHRIAARRSMPTFSTQVAPATLPSLSASRPRGTTRSARARRPALPKVETHFRADMDAEVPLNHTTTIQVDVARETLAPMEDRATAGAIGMVDPGSKLLVQAVARDGFVVADLKKDRQELDVPKPGETVSLYFDVKAAHEGPGEIWIIVRQHQMGVARLVLNPTVVAHNASTKTRRTRASGSAVDAPRLRDQLDQLLIIEQTIGETVQYLYELEMPSLNVFDIYTSKPLKGKRDDYVTKLYEEIEARYVSNYNATMKKADVEAFTRQLQSYGATLFEELFPREMQEMLWMYRDQIKSIRVVSTEPFIPWEIVHLREPGKPIALDAPPRFLGQMGLTRWLHNVDGLPPLALKVRPGRARFIIPDYPHPDWKLPGTVLEREYVQQAFNALAIEPQPNPVTQVLAQPGAVDLLHFACHGEAESDNITHARIVLEGRVEGPNFVPTYLEAATVDTFARFRDPEHVQPIVFLNACQAGRGGYKLTGIGGFAQAFLRAGAGAFVGTLWSVGDEPAFSFGKEFYERLRSGATIADSAIAAREASRKAGDATWLAYVVYAHPHAVLT
jgi:hypothetical protein